MNPLTVLTAAALSVLMGGCAIEPDDGTAYTLTSQTDNFSDTKTTSVRMYREHAVHAELTCSYNFPLGNITLKVSADKGPWLLSSLDPAKPSEVQLMIRAGDSSPVDATSQAKYSVGDNHPPTFEVDLQNLVGIEEFSRSKRFVVRVTNRDNAIGEDLSINPQNSSVQKLISECRA